MEYRWRQCCSQDSEMSSTNRNCKDISPSYIMVTYTVLVNNCFHISLLKFNFSLIKILLAFLPKVWYEAFLYMYRNHWFKTWNEILSWQADNLEDGHCSLGKSSQSHVSLTVNRTFPRIKVIVRGRLQVLPSSNLMLISSASWLLLKEAL